MSRALREQFERAFDSTSQRDQNHDIGSSFNSRRDPLRLSLHASVKGARALALDEPQRIATSGRFASRTARRALREQHMIIVRAPEPAEQSVCTRPVRRAADGHVASSCERRRRLRKRNARNVGVTWTWNHDARPAPKRVQCGDRVAVLSQLDEARSHARRPGPKTSVADELDANEAGHDRQAHDRTGEAKRARVSSHALRARDRRESENGSTRSSECDRRRGPTARAEAE